MYTIYISIHIICHSIWFHYDMIVDGESPVSLHLKWCARQSVPACHWPSAMASTIGVAEKDGLISRDFQMHQRNIDLEHHRTTGSGIEHLGETILMYCRIFARGRWWKAQIWAQIEESGWLPAQFLDVEFLNVQHFCFCNIFRLQDSVRALRPKHGCYALGLRRRQLRRHLPDPGESNSCCSDSIRS